jgi:hypothetical protein
MRGRAVKLRRTIAPCGPAQDRLLLLIDYAPGGLLENPARRIDGFAPRQLGRVERLGRIPSVKTLSNKALRLWRGPMMTLEYEGFSSRDYPGAPPSIHF